MTTAQPLPPLRMSPHVRACVCKEQIVLLDLRRSRYLSLGSKAAGAMSEWVKGWPRTDALDQVPAAGAVDAASRDHSAGAAVDAPIDAPIRVAMGAALGATMGAATGAAIGRLLELGLLTRVDEDAVPASAAEVRAPIALPQARRCLESEEDICVPGIRSLDVLRFMHAAVQAQWWLRKHSLERIATCIAARRASASAELASASDIGPRRAHADSGGDSASAAEATRLKLAALKFAMLRPFAFTARDQCLRDSLALMAYLAPLGLRAHWIIGVRTRPFGAHSWVQSGDLVLNDHHEHVLAYQPILIV